MKAEQLPHPAGLDPAGQEPLPAALTAYTGFLVAKAHQRLYVRFSKLCRDLGIEVPHAGMLHLLAEHKSLPQQQLGRLLRIDRTSMVRLVDLLEQGKLARRVTHPDDRRAYLVQITAAGRRTLLALQKIGGQWERELLPGFTEKERQIVQRALMSLAG